MVLHDAYARRTPWELSFPDPEAAERRLRPIGEEAERRGLDPADPDLFPAFGATAEVLAALHGPGSDAAELRRHGAFLYHAFHFHRAGTPLYLLTERRSRELVDPATAGASTSSGPRPASTVPRTAPALPAPAGYVQLPRHLFWATPEGVEVAESADGFFWTAGPDDTLSVLLVLGLRDDRPGFSVVSLQGLPLGDAPLWASSTMREEGGDFGSTLPGSEVSGLYELRVGGEVLKLAARVLGVLPEGASELRRPPEGAQGPTPTRLPYRRLD